jgi:hypothetical protein
MIKMLQKLGFVIAHDVTERDSLLAFENSEQLFHEPEALLPQFAGSCLMSPTEKKIMSCSAMTRGSS